MPLRLFLNCSTRDAWMQDDLAGWLAPNRLYPGVADALRGAMGDPGADVSIVTTKQARFTHALLRDLAGVDMPMERIHSQTASGRPKTEVLARLAGGAQPGTRLVFVEDKLSTLHAVARAPGFEAWELFLGAHHPRGVMSCVITPSRAVHGGSDASHSPPVPSHLGLQHPGGAGQRGWAAAHPAAGAAAVRGADGGEAIYIVLGGGRAPRRRADATRPETRRQGAGLRGAVIFSA